MFDKFGEFDSAEELNRAAKAQLEEGDMEALYAMAAEQYGEGPDVIRTEIPEQQKAERGDKMGRLTRKEASGKWRVDGMTWEQLQEGKTITEEVGQRLYGCLCKLKDYEDTGLSPYQMGNWWYELEDMAGHVCDDLCRYRQELSVQEELEEMCESCPVSACKKKLLDLTE